MDRDEYLLLFDAHHLPLYRFAYRMTGSVADAEDVVQECFLELLRPGCSYDAKRTPIRTYLFGVVRNQSLKRVGQGALPVAEGATIHTPECDVLRTELERAVALAVTQLPEGQREALILAHYEQMSLVEIARVMEIEVTAVKSRLQRARAHLKETLAAYAPASFERDGERKR
jgi:RNA polymerase sigma-70 factor (ECF subfamily)